ncbi:sensor domain-containing diguanylate cyclase [Pseudoalteromonas luteoviolacea]|uniref:sensor domain-containing diguanylate cyclase n=1 Tax=Pseudoalteromonas luteoviolacea TaxID=43657 RepID=UPI0011542F42|nr:diguanylate cyclase [Pseudoalteromonas luteoviolacea]TQF70702.1 GGDEF domain-containing protein [Pseudoalteromonas luteoviolacea]
MKVLLVFLLCCGWVVSGSEFINTSQTNKYVNLSSQSKYIQDNNFGIVDVLSLPKAAWFENNADNLNLGYTAQSYWVKVNFVLPKNTQPHIIEIAYPVLDSLKLYLMAEDTVISYAKLGDKQAFSDRLIQHHNYLVPIESDISGAHALYIKVNSSSALQLPIRLWTVQKFYETDQFNMLFLGIYFGLMSVMAIYNLLMYFSLRDKTQLYYVVYVSAIIAFYMSLSGLGFRYLWQNSLWWNDQSILFFLIAAVLAGTLFIVRLLELKKNSRTLYYGCVFIAVIGIMLLFLSMYFSYGVMIRVIIVYASLACLWGVITRTVRLFEGSHFSTYYSLAWNAALCGGIILAANKFNFLPSNWFTEHALTIGTSIEVACLSFAMAERINSERKKRFIAQAKSMSEIRKANQLLEIEVESRTRELQDAYDKLKHTSRIDELTQVFNRRSLNEALNTECLRAKRFGHSISVLMVDIDHFKKVNDTYGHQCGDKCLSQVANVLKDACTRAGDTVARYGGEEFCILLPECNEHDALELGEIIRKRTQATAVRFEDRMIKMTVSIGVTTGWGRDLEPHKLIKQADLALYFAKQHGRNQVSLGSTLDT